MKFDIDLPNWFQSRIDDDNAADDGRLSMGILKAHISGELK